MSFCPRSILHQSIGCVVTSHDKHTRRTRWFRRRTQFERAGWDRITSPTFDWSAITSIRIGWGGYIGAEDEKAEFTCAAPREGWGDARWRNGVDRRR